ncbi:MAG: NUDIX domain-containing protein, partial [Actinomycetota bacterium]
MDESALIRVAGVILHREGRVLLQHRDDNPEIVWPGHWAIFGGHMEPGEAPEEAALRELEEELELRLEGPLELFSPRNDGVRERFIFAAPLPVEPAT